MTQREALSVRATETDPQLFLLPSFALLTP